MTNSVFKKLQSREISIETTFRIYPQPRDLKPERRTVNIRKEGRRCEIISRARTELVLALVTVFLLTSTLVFAQTTLVLEHQRQVTDQVR